MCSTKASTNFALRRHVSLVHEEKVFQCNICGAEHKSYFELYSHHENDHKGIIICDDKTSPSKKELNSQKIKNKPLKCTICNFICAGKTKLCSRARFVSEFFQILT